MFRLIIILCLAVIGKNSRLGRGNLGLSLIFPPIPPVFPPIPISPRRDMFLFSHPPSTPALLCSCGAFRCPPSAARLSVPPNGAQGAQAPLRCSPTGPPRPHRQAPTPPTHAPSTCPHRTKSGSPKTRLRTVRPNTLPFAACAPSEARPVPDSGHFLAAWTCIIKTLQTIRTHLKPRIETANCGGSWLTGVPLRPDKNKTVCPIRQAGENQHPPQQMHRWGGFFFG